MDKIEKQQIECLIENTEENDLLGVVSSDDNTSTYVPNDQNTYSEQSIFSASYIGIISNESQSEYSYHKSDDDDDLPLSMRRTFLIGQMFVLEWRIILKLQRNQELSLRTKSEKTILKCKMLLLSYEMLDY